MNEYVDNLQVRTQRPTVIPLPFEAMQQSLAMSQARYDQAEAMEIDAKSKVSALSSPVQGYQEYLDDYKARFLKDATALHSSNPDKGSPEYKRKLNELLATYSNDRNRMLIERETNKYLQYIEDVSALKKEGKYLSWRDNSKTFNGKDDKGNIIPFTYVGLEAGKNVDQLLNMAIDNTPEVDTETISVDNATGKKIKIKTKGKNPDDIISNAFTALGPDGVKDWAEKNGIDPNHKNLYKIFSQSMSQYGKLNTSVSVENDFSAAKEARERYTFNKENTQEDIIPDPLTISNPTYNQDFANIISDDGTFIGGTWDKLFGKNSGMVYNNLPDENKAKASKIITNSRKFYPDGRTGMLAYKNSKTKPIEAIPITDAKSKKDVLTHILSRNKEFVLYDEAGKPVDPNILVVAAKNPKDNLMLISHRLSSSNPYAPEAYKISLNGQTYIAGFESLDNLANQNHIINKAFSQKEYVDLENYYDDDPNSKTYGKTLNNVRVFIDPNDIRNRKVEKLK